MYYYLEGWVDLGWYREFAEYAPGIFAIHNQTEDNQIQGKPRPERVLYRDSDGSSARYENPNRGLSLNLGNISHLRVIVSTVGNLQSPVDPRGSKDRLQEFQSTKFRNRWQQTRRPYRGRAAITIGMKTAPATLERRFTGRAAEMLSSYLHFARQAGDQHRPPLKTEFQPASHNAGFFIGGHHERNSRQIDPT